MDRAPLASNRGARDAEAAIAVLEARSDARVFKADPDLTAGRMSGFDLARLVAALRPKIGIVVTSAHVRPRLADLPAGFRFFPKPYRDVDPRVAMFVFVEQQDEGAERADGSATGAWPT